MRAQYSCLVVCEWVTLRASLSSLLKASMTDSTPTTIVSETNQESDPGFTPEQLAWLQQHFTPKTPDPGTAQDDQGTHNPSRTHTMGNTVEKTTQMPS